MKNIYWLLIYLIFFQWNSATGSEQQEIKITEKIRDATKDLKPIRKCGVYNIKNKYIKEKVIKFDKLFPTHEEVCGQCDPKLGCNYVRCYFFGKDGEKKNQVNDLSSFELSQIQKFTCNKLPSCENGATPKKNANKIICGDCKENPQLKTTYEQIINKDGTLGKKENSKSCQTCKFDGTAKLIKFTNNTDSPYCSGKKFCQANVKCDTDPKPKFKICEIDQNVQDCSNLQMDDCYPPIDYPESVTPNVDLQNLQVKIDYMNLSRQNIALAKDLLKGKKKFNLVDFIEYGSSNFFFVQELFGCTNNEKKEEYLNRNSVTLDPILGNILKKNLGDSLLGDLDFRELINPLNELNINELIISTFNKEEMTGKVLFGNPVHNPERAKVSKELAEKLTEKLNDGKKCDHEQFIESNKKSGGLLASVDLNKVKNKDDLRREQEELFKKNGLSEKDYQEMFSVEEIKDESRETAYNMPSEFKVFVQNNYAGIGNTEPVKLKASEFEGVNSKSLLYEKLKTELQKDWDEYKKKEEIPGYKRIDIDDDELQKSIDQYAKKMSNKMFKRVEKRRKKELDESWKVMKLILKSPDDFKKDCQKKYDRLAKDLEKPIKDAFNEVGKKMEKILKEGIPECKERLKKEEKNANDLVDKRLAQGSDRKLLVEKDKSYNKVKIGKCVVCQTGVELKTLKKSPIDLSSSNNVDTIYESSVDVDIYCRPKDAISRCPDIKECGANKLPHQSAEGDEREEGEGSRDYGSGISQ